MSDRNDRWLARAAARAEAEPFFVASALAAYRALVGIDNARLADWLGCPNSNLARLALCRRPEGGSAMFGDEVRRIARHVGSDAGRLAHLLRAVENAEAMRAAAPGALMAAHDRQPTPEEPAPEPSPPDPGPVMSDPDEWPEG
jgi:hypothetical protein